MAASQQSPNSSRTDTSARESQPQQPAGAQQWFHAWMNAWQSVAGQAGANGASSMSATSPMSPFAAMSDLSQFAATLQPFMQPLAGLKLPSASIPQERLQQLQGDYSREAMQLIQQASEAKPQVPALKDRRFSAQAWSETPAYAFTAAWYLLNARYLHELVDALDAEPKTRERIRFAVQQWTAAASPSNFFALNPEAQKTLLDSQGESLRHGVQNLLNDLQRGKISQTDESGFVVGKNLANTEGSVVFENDLIQLIQYKPRTATVRERPLLIVPPCINKFYILDLQPENSLVAHGLDSGHQVYMISWRNADASIAHKTWDNYVDEGVLTAIETVRRISGREQINTLGFCVGGTMLATALSVAAARGEHPAASMTLLTAMLDFSDTGVLDVFVDEAHVQMREQTIGGKNGTQPGLMRGLEFANTFSFLRPNDLVWNYVVDNYLKGRTPVPFDLLYWNSDSTGLPGPMYVWYLRNTYLENRLREPNALTVCGEAVDLSRIDVPTFVYGSREDHIVPWKTAYASVPLLTGPRHFVLGASGHIAGVINPPAKNKRSYWVVKDSDNETAKSTGKTAAKTAKSSHKKLPDTADGWFEAAEEVPGSWWPEWTQWLDQYGGKKVKPPAQAGSADYPVIEAAPGRYVQKRD
ncbi:MULTISPECIES: class I poly(R)-hydroxyalkanoic acid synthase [Paraburkholderia]|uniref:class I poly(R)-hydroxyalkanoic acid synthase n=1 Tax=Paraburkholderia TaxID=1822464 RepID=UPI002253AE92|nr:MULTISPECIES: class I poly(R)-hydroxyalkanoic acid synthase [Paraburkholderia]MCX4165176.1 class I poly(R)-hydroxyalkanoic acid synthase [Paraburkholderia megapolitana]MDN7160668.1 class I poly(R)-hydroxyalkanoic acid synthase [Paraburkholderia sp. CHISQ3]MDQ6497715.1 class I poly(R)-hydroxyalkanoic acid synthase [Paraburkholderia megapolitana]